MRGHDAGPGRRQPLLDRPLYRTGRAPHPALGGHAVIADRHLFKGAVDATMSQGEGWRFLVLGVYIERAQLMARLLKGCFGDSQELSITDPIALMGLLRMACALEPYLRVYTADMN